MTSALRRGGRGPVPTTNFSIMLSTLVVIAGVLGGLVVLLTLIVRLSARPATRAHTPGARTAPWAADAAQPHPDAWSPLSTTSTQSRVAR